MPFTLITTSHSFPSRRSSLKMVQAIALIFLSMVLCLSCRVEVEGSSIAKRWDQRAFRGEIGQMWWQLSAWVGCHDWCFQSHCSEFQNTSNCNITKAKVSSISGDMDNQTPRPQLNDWSAQHLPGPESTQLPVHIVHQTPRRPTPNSVKLTSLKNGSFGLQVNFSQRKKWACTF